MSGRSLRNNIYSSGPMTDPIAEHHFYRWSTTTELLERPLSFSDIQFQRFSENPYFFSFVSNGSCGTLLNAFQESRYGTSRLLSFLLRIVTPTQMSSSDDLVTFASPHLNITCIPFTIHGRIWPEANHKNFQLKLAILKTVDCITVEFKRRDVNGWLLNNAHVALKTGGGRPLCPHPFPAPLAKMYLGHLPQSWRST